MLDNPFIIIRYLDDNRTVEGQCEFLSTKIDAGLAVPMAGSRAIYEAWAEAHGKEVVQYAADIPPEVPVEEPPEEEAEPEAPVEGERVPEPTPEPEPAPVEEKTEPKTEAELPEGWVIKKHGSWFVLYKPSGEKVGKGTKDRAEAVGAARKHAGLE